MANSQQESTSIEFTTETQHVIQEITPSLKIDHTKISIVKLTLPILIENVLRISLSSVDVLMLSYYSEKSVAAVGLINQFIFFLQILYMMVAVGASILISQNLGAGQYKRSRNDITWKYQSWGTFFYCVKLWYVLLSK